MIQNALKAVDPTRSLRQNVRRNGRLILAGDSRLDPAAFSEIRILALGKASLPMAASLLRILRNQNPRTLIVTKRGYARGFAGGNPADWHRLRHNPRVKIIGSAHPQPDASSLRAGAAVSGFVQDAPENTLFLCCISGGASSLVVAPKPGVSLEKYRQINADLLKSGAEIREINRVRKSLDALKGGGLVRIAGRSTVVGLILSDVVGDPLGTIASGLTHHPRARNILVANSRAACEAAATCARKAGFSPRIVTTRLQGDAARRGAQIAVQIARSRPGTCLIYGGETTVTVRGNGRGGRNQELALAAALTLEKFPAHPAAVASLGTDGIDGPTPAAGAIALTDTAQRARQRGLDPAAFLERNDSHIFFRKMGGLIQTGPTHTNVADLVFALRL
ncbi:MAG: DUF4147 domain-containing protein [Verrucomicrobiae bacterium]|nr:DUF4147 domain-containing protein [Verrucomicrobiae bacterium]